ncbi:Asp-tRNA(Asn)/Glu-tRNA(Gln) amidotransferase subunit GatB [Candidatus Campbellbacteria bacterium CG10_big_fil_rev_8_21_14_0_10_35_52]|uniref:Aspartyl/glutamyl-tRNA(Asn/Gln) amidotransferase subunit B n=1 Tax=Candidatus Campbellbacteria bacterium CG10_big_fil_rev_8_21_14_0_10_35_52 TaxID=1974527 RepID=A0A2M6WV14_9BACT|nr:MAG: Asp-tRNA(Asn)/Glu-tRNA(Gln) amidotransferase subunit GatB [Candidatus Campbellbacteria bacterium CG10_big_fil_rev_8_21_14_0_10_35_52]
MKYIPTIGLEIHAELKTKTKMFCDSKNNPAEKKPNINICPVCVAHPGTLPVINKEAVKHILKIGIAIGGNLADFTEFDRKNYFYPDIPKGYQISQYKYPLVSGGNLAGIAITRVHLEEDTARVIHDKENSLIDFNRAGIPLMEMVTEPIIKNAAQAVFFAKELQLLLRTLAVGGANMEKGEMRVEANVSLREVADDSSHFSVPLGTKVEVKNLNSFRAVEHAIDFEIKRQESILKNSEKVIQETRGWNEDKQQTFSQRLKEGSEDYRYFPDPDLPKLQISAIKEFSKENLKKEIPELPREKRERYKNNFGLKIDDANMFVRDPYLAKLFDEIIEKFEKNKELIKLASNYITTDIAGFMKIDKSLDKKLHKNISAKNFTELISMIYENKVSSRGAKNILNEMYERGGDPAKIAEEKNLFQRSDESELKKIVEKIISENERVIKDFKSGKESSLQFLIGQGMKETNCSANPEILKKLFIDFLK